MRYKILNVKPKSKTLKVFGFPLSIFKRRTLTACFFVFAFISCKKVDNFYKTLGELPQIDNNAYPYQSTYIVGDTMVITGKFVPIKNVIITIGGIPANIIKTDSIPYAVYGTGGVPVDTYKEQVSFLILPTMAGKGRAVNITLNGTTITGSPVDIYSQGGPGSLTDNLKSVAITTFADSRNVFLNCVNGKGEIYYYSSATKDLRHIGNNGNQEIVYDLSKGIDTKGSVLISTFITGGVDPQGRYLYFSALASGNFNFCRLDLSSKQLTILNQSAALGTPYEGNVGAVNLAVTGIYPGSGNIVYLSIGTGTNSNNGNSVPDAVASYNIATGQIAYIYKRLSYIATNYNGMPGAILSANLLGNIQSLRFSPDENLLYTLESGPASDGTTIIELFNLQDKIKVQQLTTVNPYNTLNVIDPFTVLQTSLGGGYTPDDAFGFMPMPGQRLQTLLFQFIAGYGNQNIAKQDGFPKWIMFDFNESRTYAYAPARFDQGNNIFQPTGNLTPQLTAIDQLLNYDAAGNLYMTANGKMTLIKTQTY